MNQQKETVAHCVLRNNLAVQFEKVALKHAKSKAEFVREAVREKLERITNAQQEKPTNY